MNIDVSVVTPTYNRANTLPRLYKSLAAQTNLNFEWVVVDDGSYDDTRELIAKLKNEAPFPVHYFYKENGGAHTARNLGAQKAKGYLILNMDSDDTMPPDVVEFGLKTWGKLEDSENYAMINGRSVYENGELVGKKFPSRMNLLPARKQKRLMRNKHYNECCEFYNAKIWKEHPCPESNEIKFVVEGTVLFKLRAKYKVYYVDKAFRIYYLGQENQLTKQGPVYETLNPAYLFYLELFNHIFSIDDSFTVYEKCNYMIRLIYAAVRVGTSLREIRADLNKSADYIWAALLYLPVKLCAKAIGTANCALQVKEQ